MISFDVYIRLASDLIIRVRFSVLVCVCIMCVVLSNQTSYPVLLWISMNKINIVHRVHIL